MAATNCAAHQWLLNDGWLMRNEANIMTTRRRIAPGVQVSPEILMRRASEAAGLGDFGDRWFEEPLSGLIALINREAALESDDTPGVRTIVRYLADRLKLVDYLKRHPEVLHETVEVAGIIVAHGRGGSTLTQRLLTASPQLTTTYWWELVTPVPLPGEPPGDFSGRQQLGRDWVEEFKRLFPEYAHIHPMDPMAADEEVVLMDRSFLSMMYTCYFNLPGYPRWLMAQDHRPAYRELKVWLQLLQHQDPRRRGKKWLLKAVHHVMSGGVPVLLETFPEAKAIITHRNLENVIGSWCSAWGPLLRIFAPGVANEEMGPRLVDWYTAALEQLFSFRAGQDDARFIDLQYRETVADPLAQFQRTMARMGLTLSARDVDAAAEWIAKNGRDTHPPHHYRLEDYGVTADEVARAFKSYHDKWVR
jgi:hypothetical protein